jgi:SAM-dependent methyltransferase
MAIITQIEQYWDRQPCNIKHGLAPEGTEEFWNNINRRRWFVGPHLWQLADFENCKGRRVLELGCGIGSDAEQFARHGAEYVGIDLSSRSIELCEQRFAVMGLALESITIGNMSKYLTYLDRLGTEITTATMKLCSVKRPDVCKNSTYVNWAVQHSKHFKMR